jgi:hypothetical protein
VWLLDLLDPPPVERPSNFAPRVLSQGGRKYATGALRLAIERVREAPEGHRNDTLNAQAHSLARFAAAGELGLSDIIVELTAAARAAGLDKRETERTIAGAVKAGLTQIRGVHHG